MTAAAEPGGGQVLAKPVRQHLAEAASADEDVETDRRFRRVAVLRPALDRMLPDRVDIAAQRRGVLRVGRARQARAPLDALTHGVDLIAGVEPRRAIMRSVGRRIRIERTEFMRVVEHGAAVVVEKGFRQGALGDDHVMRVEFDVKIFDHVDAFGLQNRMAVDQVLGLDQHAAMIGRGPVWPRKGTLLEIHRVMR